MVLFVKLLSTAALGGSIAWCVAAPSYETAIAITTPPSALVTASVVEKSEQKRRHRARLLPRMALAFKLAET